MITTGVREAQGYEVGPEPAGNKPPSSVQTSQGEKTGAEQQQNDFQRDPE